MVEYGKDGFWRLSNRGCFIRDHPKWREKHPLGPVSFDLKCPECDFMVEDVDCDDTKKLLDHCLKEHILPRVLVEEGFVWGGSGI